MATSQKSSVLKGKVVLSKTAPLAGRARSGGAREGVVTLMHYEVNDEGFEGKRQLVATFQQHTTQKRVEATFTLPNEGEAIHPKSNIGVYVQAAGVADFAELCGSTVHMVWTKRGIGSDIRIDSVAPVEDDERAHGRELYQASLPKVRESAPDAAKPATK